MDLPKRALFLYHAIILLFSASPLPLQSLGAPTIPFRSNETDLQALMSFKSLLSDPLGVLNSWNDSNPFCNWQGVTCGRQHADKVTALRLESKQLLGPISPNIGNLTFLKVLRLGDNDLSGRIPSEIGRLSRLENLNLSMNYLSGEVPYSLTRCSNLQIVSLRNNNLTGEIPSGIGSLLNLLILNIGENSLTGGMPPSIGNMSSLFALLLHKNFLEGSIPESMGLLSSLQLLQITQNMISGEIPSSLYNISALITLSTSYNNLTGTLPSTMFNTLSNLETLLLYNNSFHGSIPVSLPNASTLVEIDLNTNNLVGTIPGNLWNLQYLYWVQLSNNYLEAKLDSDWDFLTSMTNCSQLVTLGLQSNRLGGNLPSSIANLSSSTLNSIALGWNQISGTIPSSIENLSQLTVLSLINNSFTGPIPSTIGKLQNLNMLSLSGNRFTGQIPDSIGNLTQLGQLYLERNDLNGSIPPGIGNLKNLQVLDLSQNTLSGVIPKELLTLSSLTQHLDLSNNLLSGALLPEVGKLTNLNGISVANNKLSGNIPSSLGDCNSLEFLYLQGNAFEGDIPQSLSKLRGLQELDLSRNNLSGEIPEFLGELRVLALLNLSYNALEGEVPNEGVFKNATGVSLLGGNKLCGGSPVLNLPVCFVNSTRKKNLSTAWKVIIPVGIVVVCLLIFFLLYAILHRVKTLQKKKSFKPPIDDQFTRVSYADLLKATEGFSSSLLLGAGSFGSVYKGIMDSDEKVVAVKVLDLQIHGASNSFMAECETLKNIRHRNLVKILTVCSGIDFKGDDFKAIVLTYMANGSLEKWLHPVESEMRTLTLIQRLNISIDVASALEYLHHHGHTPIVHCDLKPSNVLLDEDLCAHVSDFGLAKLLMNEVSKPNKHQTMSIGIKGTIGYIAPEYGMGGQVSTLGDVYSYGILLLELFTGKRPTDEMFKDGLSLHKHVEKAFPDRVLDIVDPNLLAIRDDKEVDDNIQHSNDAEVEEAKCLVSLMRLGLKCSNEDPRNRMEMEDVSKELQTISYSINDSEGE